MARFLVLIWGDEAIWAAGSEEWQRENEAAHRRFNAEAGKAVLGGAELAPTAQAITLRGSGGRPKATDGPFLETKEVVGGYYLLEAADLAEATALAELLPEASAPTSGVEIRALLT